MSSINDTCKLNNLAPFIQHLKKGIVTKNELNDFYQFRIEDNVVGYILPKYIKHLSVYPEVFEIENSKKCVNLNSSLNTKTSRTVAVGSIMEIFREKEIIKGWRDELYPITKSFHDEPYMLIERAAAPIFGIKKYGIHLNGYFIKDNQFFMWIAKRSKSKLSYPSKLDQIVAGGQPYGLKCMDNLIKECKEEASIPSELVLQAKCCSMVTYNEINVKGLSRDVLFNYDLLLPDDFLPVPNDGEVENFKLMEISEIMTILKETSEFKSNCATVIIDFLVRHGILNADQTGYSELTAYLKSGDYY